MVPFAHDGREEQTHTVPSARGNGKRARITLSAGSAGFQPASSFPCWERQPPAGLGEGNAGWKPALPAPVGSIFCPLWETGGRHTHWPLQSEKSNPWGRLRRPGGTDQRPAVPGALRQEMSAGRRPDPRRRREPGPLPLQGSPHGPDDHLHACPRRVPAPPPPARSPLGLPPGPLLRLPGPRCPPDPPLAPTRAPPGHGRPRASHRPAPGTLRTAAATRLRTLRWHASAALRLSRPPPGPRTTSVGGSMRPPCRTALSKAIDPRPPTAGPLVPRTLGNGLHTPRATSPGPSRTGRSTGRCGNTPRNSWRNDHSGGNLSPSRDAGHA